MAAVLVLEEAVLVFVAAVLARAVVAAPALVAVAVLVVLVREAVVLTAGAAFAVLVRVTDVLLVLVLAVAALVTDDLAVADLPAEAFFLRGRRFGRGSLFSCRRLFLCYLFCCHIPSRWRYSSSDSYP